MELSFVVLTWNSEKYLEKCISTVLDALVDTLFKYEIFIVDNGSKDGTVKMIKEWQRQHPDTIKPIFLDRNTGTTYSRNLALKKASGEYIVVMDSDIEVSKGAIERLLAVFQSHDSIGLVVPRLNYPSGNPQKSTDRFPTLFSKLKRFFFLKYMEKRAREQNFSEEIRPVEYAISAFWVLRRKVIDAVGLLDENIFYSPEDVDYCLRIWKGGFSIVQSLDVAIVHDAQEISRGFKINRATINHIKGLLYFFNKHGYLFNCPVTIPVNAHKSFQKDIQ